MLVTSLKCEAQKRGYRFLFMFLPQVNNLTYNRYHFKSLGFSCGKWFTYDIKATYGDGYPDVNKWPLVGRLRIIDAKERIYTVDILDKYVELEELVKPIKIILDSYREI